MKLKFLILLFAISGLLFANDTYIEVSGGSLADYSNLKNENIQMIAETIKLTLYNEYYTTEVYFVFKNEGPGQSIKVGFPQWHRGTTQLSNFIDFECTVNGVITPFEEIITNNPKPHYRHLIINKWFVRDVFFESISLTTTSIKYSVPYGSYGNGAEYLYGTGSTWKGNISKVNIIISNKSDRWINDIEWDFTNEEYTLENINEKIVIELNNVNPDFADLIILTANKIPRGLVSNRRVDPERYWLYDYSIINKDDLKLLTKSQLRLLRNLIFAAKGHIFSSIDINEWLNTYCSDWYKGERKVSLEDLTDIERQNVNLIRDEERKRKE